MRKLLPAWALCLGMALAVPSAQAQTQNWYRCNTHTHTAAAGPEVPTSPADAVEWYRTHGYDCVVLTDHEHVTDVATIAAGYAKAVRPFLVMTGQEIGQAIQNPSKPWKYSHYHINGLNISKVIWPIGHPRRAGGKGTWEEGVPGPATKPSELYRQLIDEIYAQGGVPQVNHPNLFWSVKPEDLLAIERPFLMEVWNGYMTSNNLGGADEAGEVGLSTEQLWDLLLSAGKVVYGTATDDTHDYVNFDQSSRKPTPGKAWIVVQAPELTKAAFNKALLEGRFYATNGVGLDAYAVDDKAIAIRITPPWSGTSITPGTGSGRFTTRFVGQGGKVLSEVAGLNPRYEFRGDETYVRASIIDSDGRRAWTQPVFRDGRRAAARF